MAELTSPSRYEQDALWGHLKEMPDIREKVRVFEHTIPDGIETILDVGCGDGAITNELGRRWRLTGVDGSRAALGHVEGEAILADATELPFDDQSFDLVLSSQMLEHLESDAYRAALDEMMRVTRRHLLISVPYREDLRMRMVRCPRCGWRGHVWGHHQSFTIESLARDLVGFAVIDVRIFGDLQAKPWPASVLWASHNLVHGFYNVPGQSTLCERCGNDDFSGVRGLPPPIVKRALDRLVHREPMPFWLSVLAVRSTA